MKFSIVIALLHIYFAHFSSSLDTQPIGISDLSPSETIRTTGPIIATDPSGNIQATHIGEPLEVSPSTVVEASPAVASEYYSMFPNGDPRMYSPSVFSNLQSAQISDESDPRSGRNVIQEVSLGASEPASVFPDSVESTTSNQVATPVLPASNDQTSLESAGDEQSLVAEAEPESVFCDSPVSTTSENSATPELTTTENKAKTASNRNSIRRDGSLRYKITPIFFDATFLPFFIDPKDGLGTFVRSVFTRFR